ncbi:MAG: DUF3110 domain-containing protein [Cyanosarcina radialis HA8281-LM2]|jgi:hypothetical protein|nr:DUF3110 domain-containing protein [Cyanosarcina radialis HA8281-LM2]
MTIPDRDRLKKLAIGTSFAALTLAGCSQVLSQPNNKSNTVYVLLYNPKSNNEGIHAIKIDGVNRILMFDSQANANSFAAKLTGQNFLTPSVEAIDINEVLSFCRNQKYICELIPAGVEAMPPNDNLPADRRDWQPLPNSISSNKLETLSCEDEGKLRSPSSEISTNIQLINRKKFRVKVYWIDFQGKRQHYFDLEPNETRDQQTFVSHPWIVTEAGDNQPCIKIFLPNEKPKTVIID